MTRPSRTGGKTSGAKSRNPSRLKGGKTTRTKRRIAPAGTRVKGSSVSALNKDLKEAREQQAATAEILKVIASSPDDVQPVFQAIAERTNQLVGGLTTVVWRILEDVAHLVAFAHADPLADAALMAAASQIPLSSWQLGETIRKGEVFSVSDTEEDTRSLRDLARLRGFRSVLYVPLLRNQKAIGIIGVTRVKPGQFADHHVQLLRTFADQAVIAIENTRLFNEVQARTVELTESLEQQTATSEVLRVISSSPGDLAPVFDTMLRKAMELCGANFGTLNTFDGTRFETAATYGLPSAYDEFRRKQPLRYGPGTAPTLLIRGEPFVQMTDLPESEAYRQGEPNRRALVDLGGARCLLAVPLLKDERVVGNVMIFRQENRCFSEKQITLLKQFAAQAVIAIENTRLLSELRERTKDLSESLQQQTATADVLKVISRSAFNLQIVLDTLVELAAQLCEADEGIILQPKSDGFGLVANWGLAPGKQEFLQSLIFRPGDGRLTGRVLTGGNVVHIPDVLEEPGFIVRGDPDPARTRLGVPLIRDGAPVGVFVLTRRQVRPFTDRQIELVQTFAAQAVIAVENARLFNETREALERQTATADILKVIASSPSDLQPVFEAIAERSNRIVDGFSTTVLSIVNETVHLSAFTPTNPAADEALKAFFPRPLSSVSWSGAIRRGEIFQISDFEVEFPAQAPARKLARLRGWRSSMYVPLLRDRKPIGAIGVTRVEAGSFADHHVQLLKTFADQAVIAISNVRLFNEVQDRTKELSQSLDELRAAQDRLVQTEKLASLGQLTAGIAHEIKNPLNFVNNFASLSAEMTDELNDVLKRATLAEKVRAEVDELTGLLKDNLSKIVQHGKRADSIVKNMLLHSRQGGGELRPTEINALVDESLNLAYHGARAENPQFNVMLQRHFDPGAGAFEVFPQEITRVLLNLISNGFYAVMRRNAENGDVGFEPTVSATTHARGDHVEIRIRDNGIGIPSEVKEKIFNPFFTTKPAGEGTGLGLSMSHDIVVKQHGGRIDVDSEPGAFTEFIVSLPRKRLAQ